MKVLEIAQERKRNELALYADAKVFHYKMVYWIIAHALQIYSSGTFSFETAL